MKSKLIFRRLFVMLPLFAVILFISSCTKEEIVIAPGSDIPADVSLKDAHLSAPVDMVCDLIAGQNMNVGKVVYSNDGENLLVEYVAMDGWMLSEVHLYVGNMEDFEETCMNKKAVKIGKFPYSESDIDDDTWSFAISLDGIEPDGDGYLVVAHAVVKNGEQEETAFANCAYQPIITAVKAKFSNGLKGYTEGDHFGDEPNDWCYWLGTNIYEDGDSYSISRGGWEETYGEVSLNDDGTNLYINVTANEGLNFVEVWIYVGTMNGLLTYLSDQYMDGVCPEYWRFPYSNNSESSSHSFSLPIPEPIQSSISFEQAFNIKRWGWISYYNF